ncbi:probable serine/threonine-protein kinase GIN4 at C-terminar half [Coccomyxa sp. Obi]|nr:probable serine/threonine-protein kinase GIN4 at C-terminar half [Coccomyxa sp. Obi]
MGACLSAQRGPCSDSTCPAQSRSKATLPRTPLTDSNTQDHGPGCPATAVTSSPASALQLLAATKTITAAKQPTKTAADIAAAVETPSTQDPAAQIGAQDITAPQGQAAIASSTEAAAAPQGIVDWRLAPTATATVTVQPITPKNKVTSGEVSAQALELSRHNFIPLTLAWTAAERKCTVLKDLCICLDQKLSKEQAVKRAAVGALAASAQLAADLACQLSTEQESLRTVKEGLRGKDEALAAAVAEATRLQRELDEQRGGKEETESQFSSAQAQLAQQEGLFRASQAQLVQKERQLSAAQAQVAEQDRQLRAGQALLTQQAMRLSLLPKTMARATELARQLAAAESAAADANAKLKAERVKGVRLAWMVRKTEHFAQTLEALHDDLPHLSEDDLTTVGVLGKGGFARVDHKAFTCADGSTAEVAVKVALLPEQPAAAADASPAAAEASSDASSDASSAPSSAAVSEADSAASSAASSAGDPAPAAACSISPATCSEDEEDDSDSDEDEEDDSDSGEDDSSEEVDLSDEVLRASIKSRALRLEGAVLNKLCGLPCILGAQAWQGQGRTGLVLPLAKGGSLKDLLWPVPGDRSVSVPQDREQVLRIAGGLCTALLAAHAQGVAHLDVKPDNVLLDADLNVQLADWGTAAPLSFTAAQWRARGLTGSAGLIFPGVLYNPASGGVRTDVYAAAALCYGMLTGRDYARECWQQYRKLPEATREAIREEAVERCEMLGCAPGVEPTGIELLMVAQFRDHVRVAQVGRRLQLLGGASTPEPLAPLMYWTQQALKMETWKAHEVTLQDMKSAIFESWRRLHQLA